MKILRNYLLKEFLVLFMFSLLVFTFSLVTGNIIKLAQLVINKGVDISLVGRLFIYLIPFLFSYTIPMSTLAATLILFGRLSSDNEITAMRASGIHIIKLSLPFLVLGFVFSLFLVFLNDMVIPRMHFESRKLIKEIGIKNPAAYLEPGIFIKSFKDYLIFIQEIDRNKLEGVRIYQPQENKPTRTIIAQRGELISLANQNAVKLKLINGTSDEPNPSNPTNFYKLNFKTYYLTLSVDESIASSGRMEKKPKEMNFKEIKSEIKKLGGYHSDIPALITEFHRKISISFASLVFILMGIPLGIFTRRGEKTVQFVIALLVIVVYYVFMAFGIALSLKGIGNPLCWMYAPNVIFIFVGIGLFKRIASI